MSRSPPLSCSKIPSPPPPTEENAKGKCRRRQREPGFPFQPFHPTSSYAPCCGLKGTSLERRHDFSGLPRGRGEINASGDRRRRGSYLLKCSLIRSSLMLSGRLPTHRCRVSRTIAAGGRDRPPPDSRAAGLLGVSRLPRRGPHPGGLALPAVVGVSGGRGPIEASPRVSIGTLWLGPPLARVHAPSPALLGRPFRGCEAPPRAAGEGESPAVEGPFSGRGWRPPIEAPQEGEREGTFLGRGSSRGRSRRRFLEASSVARGDIPRLARPPGSRRNPGSLVRQIFWVSSCRVRARGTRSFPSRTPKSTGAGGGGRRRGGRAGTAPKGKRGFER